MVLEADALFVIVARHNGSVLDCISVAIVHVRPNRACASLAFNPVGAPVRRGEPPGGLAHVRRFDRAPPSVLLLVLVQVVEAAALRVDAGSRRGFAALRARMGTEKLSRALERTGYGQSTCT